MLLDLTLYFEFRFGPVRFLAMCCRHRSTVGAREATASDTVVLTSGAIMIGMFQPSRLTRTVTTHRHHALRALLVITMNHREGINETGQREN